MGAKWGKAKVTSAPAVLAPESVAPAPLTMRRAALSALALAMVGILAGCALAFIGWALGVGFWLAAGLVTP